MDKFQRNHLLPLALATAVLGACGTAAINSDLRPVTELDLKRYEGLWYDVADFPQRFQKDCVCTRAQYTVLPTADVAVYNSCRTGAAEGRPQGIVGRARLPDPAEPGKLKVSFFPPFEADYWVIERGEQYEYAVVSDPSKETLWVLSRTPVLDAAVLDGIKQRIVLKGFDLSRLVEVSQEGCPVGDGAPGLWFPTP